MNVLSIDVGLKNLGLCLFTIQSNDNFGITIWDSINLCDGKKKICCSKNKKKIKCTKSAKFQKNGLYYCKIHAKKTKFKIPPQDFKPKSLKKKKIHQLKQLCTDFNISFHKKDKKNKCFSLLKNYISKEYLDFIVLTNTNDLCLTILGREMKIQFDNIFRDIHIDCVIVENQVSPLANRMRIFQGMIIQHFIEKNIQNIQNISAKNKLEKYLGQEKKTTYLERKKMSIKITTDIICANNYFSKWDNFFISHKKKDDLADSFLQAIWYLQKHKIINPIN